MRIDIVCDVGSMDGADALRFRVAVPKSTVYAFEPNPDNFRVMEANRMLTASNIQLLPWAVTNNDGEADFFVLKTDPDGGSRGMSSLYKRSNSWPPLAAVVPVRTTRLDSFLASRIAPNDRLALWIDTEGKAFEVIEGAIGVAKQVHVVHVEVEDTPYIAANQRLYAEVMMLLTRLGFSELATDQKPSGNRNTQSKCENRGSEPWLTQFNALFIRTDLSLRMRCRVRAQLWYAWLRDVLIRALLKWCPACLRRYQEMRHRSLGRRRTRRT
ncbi:MAG: FkbM family methyltransferase [Terriglobales bacterium]